MGQAESCYWRWWILGWGPMMTARFLRELELLVARCIPPEFSVGSRRVWDGGKWLFSCFPLQGGGLGLGFVCFLHPCLKTHLL